MVEERQDCEDSRRALVISAEQRWLRRGRRLIAEEGLRGPLLSTPSETDSIESPLPISPDQIRISLYKSFQVTKYNPQIWQTLNPPTLSLNLIHQLLVQLEVLKRTTMRLQLRSFVRRNVSASYDDTVESSSSIILKHQAYSATSIIDKNNHPLSSPPSLCDLPAPNRLFVEESTTDDNSVASLSAQKMEELGLFRGDTSESEALHQRREPSGSQSDTEASHRTCGNRAF